MENTYYLTMLAISLCCLGVIDSRYKLAWFCNQKRTAVTLLVGVLFFTAWDVSGIGLGIFFVGPSKYLTGIRLLPEFPIEELFFLLLLTYSALLSWRFWEVRCSRT